MINDAKTLLTELDEYVSAIQLKHFRENHRGLRELIQVQDWIMWKLKQIKECAK